LAGRGGLADGRRGHFSNRPNAGRGRCPGPELISRIDFECHNLSDSFPAGSFDLVSAQFLHSPVPLDGPQVLRKAARVVASGGTLLIADHGSAPRRAWKIDPEHHFPSAEAVVESLNLDAAQWEQLRAGPAERQATGPNGEVATVIDNVMVLRRIA
jgi:ubiquinone/menaquinone biosynthesis C-methylase UbiE